MPQLLRLRFAAHEDVLRLDLAAPVTIYLATGDVTREHLFNASPDARRQEPHRLGHAWNFNWRKAETPDIAHAAATMVAAKKIEDALFGTN